MLYIEWTQALCIDVPEIDWQHRGMVETINKLHEAMSAGHGRDIQTEILRRLIHYTRIHFASEEALMRGCQYPAYEEHRLEHEHLTAQVLKAQQRLEQQGETLVTIGLLPFLRQWLIQHIADSDHKISAFVHQSSHA